MVFDVLYNHYIWVVKPIIWINPPKGGGQAGWNEGQITTRGTSAARDRNSESQT